MFAISKIHDIEQSWIILIQQTRFQIDMHNKTNLSYIFSGFLGLFWTVFLNPFTNQHRYAS